MSRRPCVQPRTELVVGVDRRWVVRKAIAVTALAMLVGGCTAASSVASPSASPAAVPSSPAAATTAASPDPRLAEVDAAQARWESRKPSTFAYTFTHIGPSGVGWNWNDRVTSLDGRVEAQSMDGSGPSDGDPATAGIDGLFDTVRRQLGAPGDLQVQFDPDLGYPVAIAYEDRTISDAEWTETVSDLVTRPDIAAASLRDVLKRARKDWRRLEPTTYQYIWRQFGPAAGPTSGTAWRVGRADGQTSTSPELPSDGAFPAEAASVVSTFDAVTSALDAGAWADVTVDPRSGLPLLVAIDPSPSATGDEYWIRITFRNIEQEDARGALEAAMARWTAASLQHFSYDWRYRGELDPLTYGVTHDGERSALRRAPGTPIPEARSYATPRIDDTFRMIGEVLAEGGRVSATYDPVLGYPVRVEIDPNGEAGARGTITIKDFRVR